MQQTNKMMATFSSNMLTLQQSTAASTMATEQQINQTKEKLEKKGPTNNKFPKFSNQNNESFNDWYDDIMCILSLSEWKGIYDTTMNDIVSTTTAANESLSEHLYTSLRLSLQGDAANTMKSNENKFRQKGIEFLQSMKPIFDPKWPITIHAKKLASFCEFYRTSSTTIDQFATQFKRQLRQLRYNNITISPTTAKHTFLQGLGSEFISIRNMSTLPPDFHTDDIDLLTKAAREHLARVLANREIQRHQQQQNQRRTNQQRPSNSTSSTTSTSAPSLQTPSTQSRTTTTTTTPSSSTPTNFTPQQDFQKEIMREIGFRVHTPQRIAYWQQLAGNGNCYYHRTPHSSHTCTRLLRATERANAGSAPTSTFIPNPRFQSTAPPPPQPAPAPTPAPAAAPNPTPTARLVSTTNITDSGSDTSSNNPVDINNSNFDSDYYLPVYNKPVALPTPPSNLPVFRIVVDSGATEHMCCDRDLFTEMTEYLVNQNRRVKLGDGIHTCSILGKGTIQLKVNNKIIKLHDVLYVPDLEVSLFSVKTHMRHQGCYEHSQNNTCTLAFPSFTFDALTNNDIEFYASPSPSTDTPDFDDSKTNIIIPKQSIQYIAPTPSIDHVQISSTFKTKPIQYVPRRSSSGAAGYDLHSPINTTIPPNSRKTVGLGFNIAIPEGMYGRIAPRSGLALKHQIDVAAGVIDPDFRGEVKVLLVNSSQRKFEIKEGDRIAQLLFERIALPAFHTLAQLPPTKRNEGGFGSTGIHAAHTTPQPSTIEPLHQLHSDSTTKHDPPPIRTADKPQPVQSANKTINVDELRKLIGFRNTDTIIPHLHECFQNNFHLSSLDREPVLNLGEVATIDKSTIPRGPVPLPKNFGDVMHVDIGYGCQAGIAGIKYALFIVDRATRYKFVYPIKSLENDVLTAFKLLVRDMGFAPKRIITDFDYKLMGQKISDYFNEFHTVIECAPPRHQHKNGLVERNWRTVVRMARSWLTAALLPSSFWFYAIKRAIEVSNYMPVNVKGMITTPFELVHHSKPDLHSLIPLFSVSYIDHPMTNTTKNETMSTQSLRTILIGKSTKTTALEFYHPPSKQIITSAVYRLDPTLAAGPIFDLNYDGGLFFNTYFNNADHHRPPQFTIDQSVYFQPNKDSSFIRAKVLSIPQDTHSIFTIQRQDNLNIIQMLESRLLDHDPTQTPQDTLSIKSTSLPSWIKQHAPATLFLPTMPKPRRGTLKIHTDQQWYFHYGRSNTTEPTLLKNFDRDARDLIHQQHLIRGHPPFHTIIANRKSIIFKESVARHVSAASLKNLDAPTLIQMQSLIDTDKEAWNQAYDEEYDGLNSLPAWTPISEEQYKEMRSIVGNALPTMAISTIKFDENGQPKRCKWRIVALGNLDPHDWAANDCYAPVLSMIDIRVLTSLAIYFKRKLKNGDIKQAFVQAVLPNHEKYILKPPPGCPRSPPNTYWLLKRTLYGLKRSPRHWFEKATDLLAKCDLHPTPNNPCMFTGKPDGTNTLYLGLYVDDLCYFSTSDSCERIFEEKLCSLTNVDFMGPVTHFLGIKFRWQEHDNGHLEVHLSQQAFTEQLISNHKLDHANPTKTPYRSGHPVDSVPHSKMSTSDRKKLSSDMKSIVGSLLWLSQGTRPDLSTIVSMLASYQANPSYGHLRAARHVIRYLKGTVTEGITFTSQKLHALQAFVNFPLPHNKILPFTDANWGGQDQGHNRSTITELDRFKTRSISGFILLFNGPIHWSARRQKVTARSSAEAEIYATDECVKELLRLKHLFHDMNVSTIYMPGDPINVYNDNNACVCWSKSKTTKGLRHITIRENAIRESVDNEFVKILHIAGKTNLADMFTKEMKDSSHFLSLRNIIVTQPPKQSLSIVHSISGEEGGISTHGQTVHTIAPPIK